MKNKIVILVLVIMSFSFKAQLITLKQLSECQAGLYPCPSYTNAKDVDNLLGKFEGVWKGTYEDGRTYEFHFSKKNDDGDDRKWDVLNGRMLAKSSSGSILYNSLNNNDLSISGYFFDKDLKKYTMSYTANAKCNDSGYIYISFPDSSNLTQLKLVFMQDLDIGWDCPSGYKTVIPDAKAIILTKQ
ncbi:DUF6705 family protein [Chryseobacterium kwangjuense]|nr:DUF6705 family protein [Chryseobacterium kwangjuense]